MTITSYRGQAEQMLVKLRASAARIEVDAKRFRERGFRDCAADLLNVGELVRALADDTARLLAGLPRPREGG